jgi:hypothetical protein
VAEDIGTIDRYLLFIGPRFFTMSEKVKLSKDK